MNLTELMLQTVMGFIQGRIGQMTLVEMGANEFGSHMAWLRGRQFVYLVEAMARNNPNADTWID